ncbi:MAG: hypothetical protein AAGF57_16305 [Pseudomonadota bacterium]
MIGMLDSQVKYASTITLLFLIVALVVSVQPLERSVVAPPHSLQVSYFEKLLDEHAIPYEVVSSEYFTQGRDNWEELKTLRLQVQRDGLPVQFSMSNYCERKVLSEFLTNRDALFEMNPMPKAVRFTVLEKDHTELKLLLVRSDIRRWCTMREGVLDRFSVYG